MPPITWCGHPPRLPSSIALRLAPILLLLLWVLTGCDTAGGSAPAGPTAPPVPTALVRGADHFTRYCQVCHPGGRKGVGPVLIGIQKSDAEIKAIVRSGKANMPPYGPDRIPDADLQSLVDYVRALK